MIYGAAGSLPEVRDFDIAGWSCPVVCDTGDSQSNASFVINRDTNIACGAHAILLFRHAFVLTLHVDPENPVVHGHSHQQSPRSTCLSLSTHLLIPSIIHVYIDADLRIAYTKETVYFMIGVQVNQRRAEV